MSSAIAYVVKTVIPTALALLPPRMDTPEARAMMIAPGLQESEFKERRQMAGGPATSFWQFEEIGVKEVMVNRASSGYIMPILEAMGYPPTPSVIHQALADNDILAAVFVRLLLWRHPNALPASNQATKGWMYYYVLWRPGNPKQSKWEAYFLRAWRIVTGEEQL